MVIASYQTGGKGQYNKSWESEPGKNLTFSVFLKPVFLFPEQQFLLNQSISLGITDFIRSQVKNQSIRIKWPNDIYIADRKVAGILINNSLSGRNFLFSVVGIGINVNQEKFGSDAANPISLKNYLDVDLDLNDCFTKLLRHLDQRYRQLSDRSFQKIRSEYQQLLYRLNEFSQFLYNDEVITAKIVGTSEYGRLLLRKRDNILLECDHKEIEYLL